MAALLYFDVSFMTWVLLGPLAPFLRDDLGLSATQQGLVTAIPLLGGSLFRPLLGTLGDRIGGRRAGAHRHGADDRGAAAPGGGSRPPSQHLYAIGLLLGIAGASFAVALPLASRWYPPEYQGLAMGIAGAGNSGTLLATLFAPRLAERFGWAATLGLAMLPIAGGVRRLRADRQGQPRAARRARRSRDYGAVLRESDTLWLSFLYSLTFGGFVGLASFLTTFFHEQYQVSRVVAGRLHHAGRRGRQLPAPGRRLAVRPRRRLSPAGGPAGRGAASASASSPSLPPVGVAVARARRRDGPAGDGQRRRVPAGAAALSRSDRPGDRASSARPAGSAASSCRRSSDAIKDLTGQYTLGLVGVAALFGLGTLVLLELGAYWSARWAPAAVERTGVYSYRAALEPGDGRIGGMTL